LALANNVREAISVIFGNHAS